MRSRSLNISQLEVLKPEVGNNNYEVKYVLSDTKPASQAGVMLFDPDLEKKTEASGPTANTPQGAQKPIWNEIKTISTDLANITGEYSFVFWAIDDHPEDDKAHRKKPALEMKENDSLGAAANFGTADPSLLNYTAPALGSAALNQEAVYLDVEIIDDNGNLRYDVKRQGKYTDWKWWDGSAFRRENKVQLGVTAHQVIKGLKRVDVFSWLTHGEEDGRITIWDADTFIASDHSVDDWFQRRFGSNYQEKVIYISDLGHFAPLSKLKCAFIINCSTDRPVSENMAEILHEKGVKFVGTLVGGRVSGEIAQDIFKWFWQYASKGEIRGKGKREPFTGKIDKKWHMCSFGEALESAWKLVKTSPVKNQLQGSRLDRYWKGNGYLGRPPLSAWTDEALKKVPHP